MFETLKKIIENMGAWKTEVVVSENVKRVLDKEMVDAYSKSFQTSVIQQI